MLQRTILHLGLTALLCLCPTLLTAQTADGRPAPSERLFRSAAVDSLVDAVANLLKDNPRLATMFANCYPNTLDTTVHYDNSQGDDDTFVVTGDIEAMWLRDSGAQVWPYVSLAAGDDHLRHMLRGVILRQLRCIVFDPYANAFNREATGSMWQNDLTDMQPLLHERKYEIDSMCYPVRLAYAYWLATGDASVFGALWLKAAQAIVDTFREQQRWQGTGPYHFQRVTERQGDTQACDGQGLPVRPCGLICSYFRPSDDATTFLFLVPSNFMAVTTLRKMAHILTDVNHADSLSRACTVLADEVSEALRRHAVYQHPKYGPIYAYEVDGFGNHLLMDDANVPSLLAMAYLGDVEPDDTVYQNTRRFVWSNDNPFFFSGRAGEGIGGPHVGYDMIWPMSIMMRAFTSTDKQEISSCLDMLLATDAGTGFIHESFHKDDATIFTRPWFAWQNSLFGELILKLIADGHLSLLISAGRQH